jgi:large subunit ribosomal protein L3
MALYCWVFFDTGMEITAGHFMPGECIDIQGRGKDKGFQGVMKRWHFKGKNATHGVSLTHRAPGSIGNRKTPGKVWKGKKMAGHMGDQMRTVKAMKVSFRIVFALFSKRSVPRSRICCLLFLHPAGF